MKKVLLLAVAALGFVLLFGCGDGGSDTHSNPAQTIKVKSGDEFIISLESNPTTGYTWEQSSDGAMVSLENVEYLQDEADEEMVGVGGKEFFTFRALQSGETKIEMVYGQHWDGGEVDAPKVFTVVID